MRVQQVGVPEFDLNDENFDGAPCVVEDDPIEFKPVIISEDPGEQLRMTKKQIMDGPVLKGGYSRTGGVVVAGLESGVGPSLEIHGAYQNQQIQDEDKPPSSSYSNSIHRPEIQ